MKTQIKTEKNKKLYTVNEAGLSYRMPFILKYVLEKYLNFFVGGAITPVADWYQSLDEDRKALIDITNYKEEGKF